MIVEALNLNIREVEPTLKTKEKAQGFSRNFLEVKAQALVKEKKWKLFNDVLALVIYRIVVFSNIDDFVDFSTIGVFLDKNPVHALSTDMYYSPHIRHEKKKCMIL